MLVQYYIIIDGSQQGPFDESTMMEWAASGKISSRTLVWRAGMQQWSAAGLVPELRALLLASPGMSAGDGISVAGGEYAGFGRRAIAFLIDLLTMMPFGMVLVGIMVSAGADPEQMAKYGSPQNIQFGLIMSVLTWIYFAWRESSPAQGTFGKRVMGLKVTDLGGRRLSFLHAFGRQMGRLLSGIFLIGYFLAAVTPRRQTLHDILAGTLVFRQ